MDGFADNFYQNDMDPAAEFLAREQEQLAGLEDDISAAPANLEDEQYGCLIGHSGYQEVTVQDTAEDMPRYDLGEDYVAEFDPLDEYNMGELVEPASAAATKSVIKEEPEKIRLWREEQKQRLETKDAEEEKKKNELRESAKRELEEWYKHHEETIAKTKAANKNAEKEYVLDPDDVEPGQEWERIAKLCDFNLKSSRNSKDVSRMRSIILQLKQMPPTPQHI